MNDPQLALGEASNTLIPKLPTLLKEPEVRIKQKEEEGEIPPLYVMNKIPDG